VVVLRVIASLWIVKTNPKHSRHVMNISKVIQKALLKPIGKFEVYMFINGNGKRLGLAIKKIQNLRGTKREKEINRDD